MSARAERALLSATIAVAIVFGLSACDAEESAQLAANEPPAREAVAPAPSIAPKPKPKPRWHCSYDVTYNRNWHDDVLCTNGTRFVRPILRRGDSFVTYAEIMASARAYEKKLNHGR